MKPGLPRRVRATYLRSWVVAILAAGAQWSTGSADAAALAESVDRGTTIAALAPTAAARPDPIPASSLAAHAMLPAPRADIPRAQLDASLERLAVHGRSIRDARRDPGGRAFGNVAQNAVPAAVAAQAAGAPVPQGPAAAASEPLAPPASPQRDANPPPRPPPAGDVAPAFATQDGQLLSAALAQFLEVRGWQLEWNAPQDFRIARAYALRFDDPQVRTALEHILAPYRLAAVMHDAPPQRVVSITLNDAEGLVR